MVLWIGEMEHIHIIQLLISTIRLVYILYKGRYILIMLELRQNLHLLKCY